jgi:hypothetical protein
MTDLLPFASGALAALVLLTQLRMKSGLTKRIVELETQGAARDLALERMASELRDHRLDKPPPSVVPARSRAALTSPDWDDSDRATRALPRQPPPLPAFDRPRYMTRGA